MKTEIYNGVFFKKGMINGLVRAKLSEMGIETDGLSKLIDYPHVTSEFKPETSRSRLFGEKAMASIIGYGNDGKNEALLVKIKSPNKEIDDMYDDVVCQHITMSIADGAKAVDSRNLEFKMLQKPIFIYDGKFGGFIDGEPVTDRPTILHESDSVLHGNAHTVNGKANEIERDMALLRAVNGRIDENTISNGCRYFGDEEHGISDDESGINGTDSGDIDKPIIGNGEDNSTYFFKTGAIDEMQAANDAYLEDCDGRADNRYWEDPPER